jgi:hypothetical protein
VAFGFTTLGLHSVEAQIHPANMGSRRVLEKQGFVQEGYLRENYDPVEDQFTDTAIFSLLKATGWIGHAHSGAHRKPYIARVTARAIGGGSGRRCGAPRQPGEEEQHAQRGRRGHLPAWASTSLRDGEPTAR